MVPQKETLFIIFILFSSLINEISKSFEGCLYHSILIKLQAFVPPDGNNLFFARDINQLLQFLK